jgi:hypothetical protein
MLHSMVKNYKNIAQKSFLLILYFVVIFRSNSITESFIQLNYAAELKFIWSKQLCYCLIACYFDQYKFSVMPGLHPYSLRVYRKKITVNCLTNTATKMENPSFKILDSPCSRLFEGILSILRKVVWMFRLPFQLQKFRSAFGANFTENLLLLLLL